MRRLLVVVGLLGGCGSAVSDSSSFEQRVDAASGAEIARPIVGTLRMRDRDIALTPLALEAQGNEVLQEMTAQPVWADVDADDIETISTESVMPRRLGFSSATSLP